MFRELILIFRLFNRKEKIQLGLIFFTTLLSGLAQVVGIASIFPFIAVATNPGLIESNEYLNYVNNFLALGSQRDFLVFLGIGAFVLLFITNFITGLNVWLTFHFAGAARQKLSVRLLDYYVNQHYLYHVRRNSAELIKNLVEESGRVINSVLLPFLIAVSRYVSVMFIAGMLLYIDPVVAIVAILLLGGSYVAMFYSIRRKIKDIGFDNSRLFAERYRLATESLGGIKDLKLLGRVGHYYKRYFSVSARIMWNMVVTRTIAEIPRYILETIAFGGIILLAVYFVYQNSATELMPLLSLYAFAGYRLMPSLQSIYHESTSIKNNIAAARVLREELSGCSAENYVQRDYDNEKYSMRERLQPEKQISLENINFSYPESNRPALDNISLTIKAKTSVAFVGSSGSGKSTCADLILGLISASDGRICIDDTLVDQYNLRKWQNSIGYVPQIIFLADSTIAANIAFGIDEDDIDFGAVEKAAKMASLHDFITNELPEGYRTFIGEQGVKLSGGQRQRIGIARALYANPEVLVLDEATSALDTPTEEAIMDAVHGLSGQKTIIIIAHRISTVRECDMIYLMDHGRLVESGSYETLINQSNAFRLLAKKNEF